MSEPFIGQVSMVAFDFAPRGFATCDGQLLSINQNQALFSLLGTFYGGDGRVTFALPNLQGRAPVHRGTIQQGEAGGEEAHALIDNEVPSHAHRLRGSATPATSTTPNGNVLAAKAATNGVNVYGSPPASQPLAVSAVSAAGGGQAHPNLQPMLSISFVIALQGIFPSRN